jgi:hypothetical protein
MTPSRRPAAGRPTLATALSRCCAMCVFTRVGPRFGHLRQPPRPVHVRLLMLSVTTTLPTVSARMSSRYAICRRRYPTRRGRRAPVGWTRTSCPNLVTGPKPISGTVVRCSPTWADRGGAGVFGDTADRSAFSRHRRRHTRTFGLAWLAVVSGRAMMEALIAGQRDPRTLAHLAKARARKKTDQLEEPLRGFFTRHDAVILQMMLDTVDPAVPRSTANAATPRSQIPRPGARILRIPHNKQRRAPDLATKL